MYAFLRKSPLCRSHFFEWLKTAISSTACGTVHLEKSVATGICRVQRSPKTAKTLLKVHLRLRFQNRGKPRTAGLCGEGCGACGTAALYLVLKSNGLHRSKNLPVKFDFSLKTVPANISKKLPPQRCSKSLLIAFFNFSHKRPTFAFTDESGYTLGSRRKIAHSGSHGETRGVSDGGAISIRNALRRGLPADVH